MEQEDQPKDREYPPDHPFAPPKFKATPVKTFKQQLMEKGVWPEYSEHLRELKRAMGKEKAERICLEKFLGEDFVRMGMTTSAERDEFGEGDEDGIRGSAKSPPAKYVNMRIFEGKECSEIESIRWVASNIGMFGVKARDCPSAMAWNLLNQCRSDADFVKTFWSSMFVKAIPAKSKREEDGTEELDGADEIDMCERLIRMKEASKGVEP